jgi:hypothetical protein
MDVSCSIGMEAVRGEAKYGEATLATSLLTMMACLSVKTVQQLFWSLACVFLLIPFCSC